MNTQTHRREQILETWLPRWYVSVDTNWQQQKHKAFQTKGAQVILSSPVKSCFTSWWINGWSSVFNTLLRSIETVEIVECFLYNRRMQAHLHKRCVKKQQLLCKNYDKNY